jgi:hypothetical protein
MSFGNIERGAYGGKWRITNNGATLYLVGNSSKRGVEFTLKQASQLRDFLNQSITREDID